MSRPTFPPPSAARVRSRRAGCTMALLALCLLPATAHAQSKCVSAKLDAMGKKESGLLSCLASVAARGRATSFGRCLQRIENRYLRAYDLAGSCGTDDRPVCDCLTENCAVEVRVALPDLGPSKCEAKRLRGAGVQAMRKVRCNAKAAKAGTPVDPGCLQKADAKFEAVFAKTGTCGGDQSAVDAIVNEQCVTGIGGDASGGGTVGDLCTSQACEGAD